MQNKYVKIILIALIFGLFALVTILAGLTVPLGSNNVADPREIFVTLGSALTGPIGAIIIGLLAGACSQSGVQLASWLGHIPGALWMAIAYKKLVYEQMEMPRRLLGWTIQVLAYYFAFVLPGFVIGLSLFFGKGSALELYPQMAPSVIPEAMATTLVTILALSALPPKYHKPLW